MRTSWTTAACFLLLVACGGGGGSGTPHLPAGTAAPGGLVPWHDTDGGSFSIANLPHPAAADARHMPIYQDGRRLFVGIDQGAGSATSLPVVGQRGGIEFRFGELNDGARSDRVRAYLSTAVTSSVPSGSPPTVRVIGSASVSDIGRTIRAVQLLNAALPSTAKVRVADPLPGLSLRNNVGTDGRYYDSGLELAGTVHVEFVSSSDYRRGPYSAAVEYRLDGNASYIQFNTGASSYSRDNESTILLAHELMHALADFDHVEEGFASILEGGSAIHDPVQNGQRQPLSLLYPIDREALRAFFGPLGGRGDVESLGPWESNSWHLVGRSPHAAFGVALRNRYVEPWAYGDLPAVDLVNNRSLSGRATWLGTLLGFGPDEIVSGNASIFVELATLTGRADFTNLEAWTEPPVQRAAGTGTQWLDGDLGYAIAVRGNTFRETSGDAGRLTGIFVGHSHEGAAGTLERDDLVAAFGASR